MKTAERAASDCLLVDTESRKDLNKHPTESEDYKGLPRANESGDKYSNTTSK